MLGLALGGKFPGIGAAAGALALGFLSYGVSLVLFIYALRHLGAARTGAHFSTAPFIGAALAVPLLGEPFTPGLLAATALMAAALLATMLLLPRLFAADYDDGMLEQMAFSPQPLVALVFGAGAVDATLAGTNPQAHLSLLGACLAVALFFAPWAITASLRIALE